MVPVAVTENDADSPVHLVCETGWFSMVTGTITVSMPGFEIAGPHFPVTRH